MNKSKSSFYHHFADLEVFTTFLLSYHLDRVEYVAEKERLCTSIDELIEVIVEHNIDLLFNRQLRIHRDQRAFELCFEQTTKIFTASVKYLWSKMLGLSDHSYLADLVLALSMDNFFLQITEETLNREWMMQYFHQLRNMVDAFKQANNR